MDFSFILLEVVSKEMISLLVIRVLLIGCLVKTVAGFVFVDYLVISVTKLELDVLVDTEYQQLTDY